jgi:prepilin-type N-terminal cleavage/methylation domain-containing protein
MKHTRGFTLVEVMIASIIFAIVMLYGISFFTFGRKPVVKAQETNFALQLAEDDMEYSLNQGFTVSAATDTITSAQNIDFKRTRNLSYLSGELSQCVQVTSKVEWNSPSMRQAAESSSLITIVTIYNYTWP